MTPPTIRFYRPRKDDRKSVVAHFVLDVHVDQFGGLIGVHGEMLMVDGVKYSWIQADMSGHDSINAANAWILERFLEWERGGR